MREAQIEGEVPTNRDLPSGMVAEIVTGPRVVELSYTLSLHKMAELYAAPPSACY